jgi:hypothetical protein
MPTVPSSSLVIMIMQALSSLSEMAVLSHLPGFAALQLHESAY